MSANGNARTTSKTLRRGVVAAALPLLIGALASCGYGSQAPKDESADKKAPVAAGAKKLSASEVRIGYFPNLTHATALIGVQDGLIQKELGGTVLKPQTFNAGPSEIEALNGGSLDIGFIGPSPSINAYVKSKGKNLRIVSGSASGGVKLVVNPDRIKTLDDLKGKRIATRRRATRRTSRSSTGSPRRAGRSTRSPARVTSRSSARTTRSPRTPSSPARSTARGSPSRPRPSWSPRADPSSSTRPPCGPTRSS